APEHRLSITATLAGNDWDLLGGNGADERQNHLTAMCVAGQHEWHAERGRFGQPAWIVREQHGHRRGIAREIGDVDLALGPEPDSDEIDRLALDSQSRARVLPHLNAVFSEGRGH